MPGKNRPESFTPASRLNSDSIRSPTTAAAPSNTPRLEGSDHRQMLQAFSEQEYRKCRQNRGEHAQEIEVELTEVHGRLSFHQ